MFFSYKLIETPILFIENSWMNFRDSFVVFPILFVLRMIMQSYQFCSYWLIENIKGKGISLRATYTSSMLPIRYDIRTLLVVW